MLLDSVHLFSHSSELLLQLIDDFIGRVLYVHQLIASMGEGPCQLIELQLHRARIPILSVLNQEYHQERDYGRASIDYELPSVGIMKQAASYSQTTITATPTANAQGEPTTSAVLHEIHESVPSPHPPIESRRTTNSETSLKMMK